MGTGDFTRDTRTDGAIAVADVEVELGAAHVVDRRTRHVEHLLGQQALVERRVAVYLAELRLVGRDMVAAQQWREVQVVLFGSLALEDFQQVGTPDQLFQGAHAQLGQPLTGFFSHVGEEVDHHVDSADVMVFTQRFVLRRNAGGAVVEVANTQVFAAQGDHWRGAEAEAFSAQDRRLDHVEAGFQATVGLHPHFATQVIAAQGLVGFSQAQFPRCARVLDGGQR